MNRKRNWTLITGYLDEDFKNVLSWLPLELFLKIIDYADERTTLEKFIESTGVREKPWHLGDNGLSKNPSITAAFVDYYIDMTHPKVNFPLGNAWVWCDNGLSANPSITQSFVLKYIDKPWKWGECGLSSNPAITPNFVEYIMENYPNIRWHWGCGGLSINPSITKEFVLKYIDKPWRWGLYYSLATNPVVTPDFLEHIMEHYPHIKLRWGYGGLSSNPSITLEFVLKYIKKPWNWGEFGLSRNPAITPKFVEYIMKNYPRIKFHWGKNGLSSNTSITPEFIIRHLNKNWDWGKEKGSLSANPAVTPDFIEFIMFLVYHQTMERPRNKQFEYYTHYYNKFAPSIHGEILNNIYGVVYNPSITLEFIETHMSYIKHNWYCLSSNLGITPEIVERFIDEPWEWGTFGLSMNPAITPKFIRKHPEKPWVYGHMGISANTFNKRQK
jgi:hypothetical protein